ncbi:MAG: cellulase family glycosylhydrolase [Bacteroidales bacterium]
MNTINKMNTFKILILGLFMLSGCKKDEHNSLTATPTNIEFLKDGGSANLTIQTNADAWEISNPASDWLLLSNTSGTQKTALVTLRVSTKTLNIRTDTLTITAGDARPVEVIVSQPSSEYLYDLSVNATTLSFKRAENSNALTIITDAPQWLIGSDADWLNFSQETGESGSTTIQVTALKNAGIDPRTATITISAEFAPSILITANQKGEYYPNYNTSPIAPDASGMSSTATELAANIILGWNIGNSLEAIGSETAWGNPLVTQALIDTVKRKGFNAIRIPCSWNQYMANSSTAQLKESWLNRVKEVIQYCDNAGMYVVLNIHWDGGWLENNCTEAKQEENNAKQKAFWEQIATHLRDFDEKLLFASANEPNVDNAKQMAVLKSYHQTFIDAVRSTGGRNTYRVLVIQGPSTDITKTSQLMTTLPVDPVPNRMMVEVHYYTPWNFCGMEKDESWGNMFYYWGAGYHSTTDPTRNATYGEEATVVANFALMKNQFINKGIPVILGEYSAVRRSSLTGDNLTLHLASRAYYFYYVTKQAKANGILPFYWDNGGIGTNGSGIFYRKYNVVFDHQALDALVKGATE